MEVEDRGKAMEEVTVTQELVGRVEGEEKDKTSACPALT